MRYKTGREETAVWLKCSWTLNIIHNRRIKHFMWASVRILLKKTMKVTTKVHHAISFFKQDFFSVSVCLSLLCCLMDHKHTQRCSHHRPHEGAKMYFNWVKVFVWAAYFITHIDCRMCEVSSFLSGLNGSFRQLKVRQGYHCHHHHFITSVIV